MSETTIASGIYTIENVDRRNDIFLADDGRGTLVAGSSEDDEDPPLEARWKLTRLRNGRYFIRPAAQLNQYASLPSSFSPRSAIVTGTTRNDWVVKEAREKDTFVISHVQHQLYWGIEDDAQGTPVRLRNAPTGSGNQWRFHRLSSTTVTSRIVIESRNIDGNLDSQMVAVPTSSQPKEVIDGQPARSIPVVPQSAVESLTIGGDNADSQTATTPNQSQTKEVVEATSAAVIPQDLVELPNVEENLDNNTLTVPTPSQPRELDDGQPAESTPIVPQSVVESSTIDGSNIDSQTATIQNQSRASEVVDDRPVVSQSEIESPNIGENPECQGSSIPTQNQTREEVDGRSSTPTPVVPQSVVESRTVADGPTASGPNQTRNTNADRPAIHHILEGHTDWVRSVAFSPDSKQIVSGSDDCTIRVWDVRTRRLALEPIKGHSDWVLSVTFSPDSKRIVSGFRDKTVRIWDAQSGTLARTLNGHTDSVQSVACSPDGKRIVSGSRDNRVRVWDVETGSLVLGPMLGHIDKVNSVDFSMDGKQFLSGSSDGTIRVCDAETGHAIRTFCGEYPICSATFSPDSKQVVSGDYGGVRVWDMQSGDSIMLKGHKGIVYSVDFSSDGKRIVSCRDDKQIIVWDAKHDKAIGRLKGHTDDVRSVAFSPDGRRIVSGSYDKTVRIWEADRLDAMPT